MRGQCRWLFIVLCLAPAALYAQIEDLISPGELSTAHSKFSGVKNCNVCHGGRREVLEKKCLECHKDLAVRILAGKGFHANKRTRCMTCHTEHLGKKFDIRGLDLKTFKHEETGWKLEGLHAAVKNCAACHKTRSFLGLQTTCQSCHIDPHRGALPNCTLCHSVSRPMKQVTFDHSKTKFPLQGAHQKVPCLTCHKNQVFKGLPFANCTSCHVDNHKGTMGTNCLKCHSYDSWKGVAIKHEKFPLVGKHKTVPCQKCHPGGKWKIEVYAKCADCHVDTHLGQFEKQLCEDCHSVDGFRPARVKHEKFKLENGHAVPCERCHKLEKLSVGATTIRYKPMRTDCVACHNDVHGGQFGQKCEQCHTTVSFHVKAFDHSKTRFPLDSKHAGVPCLKCHIKDKESGVVRYKPLATNCASCHQDPHLGQFGPKQCEQCHTPEGVRVNHDATQFPLQGKHKIVPCAKCHVREKAQFPAGPGEAVRFKPIASDCKSCHEDYHRGQFKQDCLKCHTTDGFKPSTFDHAKSDFALSGQHLRLTCERCHTPEVFTTPPPPVTRVRFKPVQKNCVGCHKDPHQGKLSNDCLKCHTTSGWTGAQFNHLAETGVALNTAHTTVRCTGCHVNSVFEKVNCIDCHRKDYESTTRPNHRSAGFPFNCEGCHKVSDANWEQTQLNHNQFFPLSGRHASADCISCHVNNVYKGTARTCYGCHRIDYDQTKIPNHKNAGFPTACDNCHKFTDPDWNRTQFNHQSFYPLVGRHATVDCASCHKGGVYKGTPRDCYGCHRPDYEATRNPNHRQNGFSTNCESCHKQTDSSWGNGTGFNHSAIFPLAGRHATALCAACHKNSVYKGTPRDCYGCHRQDYEATRVPNHRQSGFSTNCESCHNFSDADWNRANLNHNQFFPLAGRHASASCESCHRNNVFRGTPRDCFGCHRTDYDSTRNPNHRQSGFSTNCESCHRFTDADWTQANLNHNQFFPLSGRHASATCLSCHRSGVYKGTPRDCFGCHRNDYDSTRSPNHRAAGFPTACDNCHRFQDSSWSQARFDHRFPITSGEHAGNPCSACHTSAGNFRTFTCLTCHVRGEMNDEHDDTGGYRYESHACFACHPDGREDD